MRLESTIMRVRFGKSHERGGYSSSPAKRRSRPGRRAVAALVAASLAAAGLTGCANLYKSKNEPRPMTPQGQEIRGGEPSTPAVPPPVTAWTYAEAPAVPSGMKVQKLLKTLSFPSGSSTLNQEAKGALIEAAKELKTNTRWHVLAAGFTDNRGEAGNAAGLSQARAEAARKYLEGQGIAADRISTQAMGSKYAEGGEFEPGQVARDRRVEVWVFM